jgi:hypothetical protein
MLTMKEEYESMNEKRLAKKLNPLDEWKGVLAAGRLQLAVPHVRLSAPRSNSRNNVVLALRQHPFFSFLDERALLEIVRKEKLGVF